LPLRRVTNRRFQASRVPARRREWTELNFSATPGVGTPTQTDLLSVYEAAAGKQLAGITIVRMLGSVELATPATVIACGIRVADDTEDADDTTPLSNPHQDWMWKRNLFAATVDHLSSNIASVTFDVRGKRRMDRLGQHLIFATEQSVGAPTVRCWVRVLLLGE